MRSRPIADVTGETLHTAIRHNVKPTAQIQTDELSAYHGIGKHFEGGHETVSHKKREYARGSVSTNEAEAFFALLKRGITGSFHSVSRQHLHRYCDEFSYRWNERKTTDEARTLKALGLIEGKRLMYKQPVRPWK